MLPQRRKSAEEIAKLRESLGIPGEAQEEAAGATEDADVDAPAPEPSSEAANDEEGKAVASTATPKAPEKAKEKSSVPMRQVRSLRKSEQKPVEFSKVETKNGIPVRRHEDRELMEMRRIQAAPPDTTIAYMQQLAAPWPLVILGYLFPLVGAACGLFAAISPKMPEPDLSYAWLIKLSRAPWLGKAGFGALAACCAIGLLFAGWFFLKKPRSRHHAGFIVGIAILIAVFGIIHQFDPNGP
ncbi:MAG TPA: hypothetical protein VGE67_05355 [Haloferula sp.]